MTKNFLLGALTLTAATMSFGQAISVNGGSISGSITDPSGAVVPNASIVVSNPATGYQKTLTTDSAGFYSVGPLNPGTYKISVTRAGFRTLDDSTTVKTGTVTSGNFKLTLGQTNDTIEVVSGVVQVNTEQPGVSDVITKEQIDSLPINGRNFLDVAQIEPGVILQPGQNFDPTKAGYSALSVSGISGRTTRILLDGQDITDETVGTTIFNVSQGSIDEFQLNRSTQDVSGDVTSTGQVLVSTTSGTNAFHGQTFYQFQDYRAGFATVEGVNAPFQRNQFGGSIGGPIIKDKLFFFGNSERIKQDQGASAVIGSIFPQLQGLTIPNPYRETYSVIRLDYDGPKSVHYFVRGNYDVNSVAGNANDGFEVYANRDNTPGISGGADFATGKFTHSFRGSYEKFHNLITDASGAAGIYNPLPGITFQNVAQGLFTGPNDLAPQATYQSDKQFRYDGTWTKGAHIIRYGYDFNRILGGGLAAFFGLAPRLRETSGTLIAGNGSDPLLDYHASSLVLGNGLGFFTEKPGFGLQAGGVEDYREGAYAADSWKIKPSFTLSVGVRWSIDTDRANQDLATPTCSQIDTKNVFKDATQLPCTGATPLFGVYRSDLGKSVHQPYADFAPQIGLAYAPGNQKTVFRAGFGMYFDSDVFNNTTNARSSLLPSGPFFADQSVCGSGVLNQPDGTKVSSVTVGGVTRSISQICKGTVQSAAPYAIALQGLYQANSAANSNAQNGGFVGENLTVNGVYGAPYRSPYSEQWNFGLQRELFKGSVLSADYVHNSTLKLGQTVDVNHVGAARFLNTTAAAAAISATLAQCGAASIQAAITPGGCPGGSGANNTARIDDFAGNGLDSGANYNNGGPASLENRTVATGAAFPGQNPLLGTGSFILPVGRSGYDALQMVYRQVASHPLPGIVSSNVQVSYSLSRIVTTNGGATSDTGFTQGSYDNDNPAGTIGRASLDHKEELSFGASARLKYGPQIGLIGHFFSASPTSLTLDNTQLTQGNIFQSDVTGDGTTGDLLPGTTFGDYQHRVTSKNFNQVITNFNQTLANTLTPAGRALVAAGLMTSNQLVALQGALQPIALSPSATTLPNPTTRLLDVNFSYPIPLARFREGLSLEPAVAIYNVANLSNFGTTESLPSGVLLNQNSAGGTFNINPSGSISGPNTFASQNSGRTIRGTGTFNQGAPRTTEFQLKLNF